MVRVTEDWQGTRGQLHLAVSSFHPWRVDLSQELVIDLLEIVLSPQTLQLSKGVP